MSAGTALGQTAIDWIGTPATPLNWLDAANWNPSGPPSLANDNLASINNGGVATLAGTGETSILLLGTQSGQSGTLQIAGGTLNTAELRVGGLDTGGLNANSGGTGLVDQNGGTVNVNVPNPTAAHGIQSLYIGDAELGTTNTAVGSYVLRNNGILNVGVAADDAIVVGTGVGTKGSFDLQATGGTVSSTGNITIARRGADATLNVAGGTFSTAYDLNIGYDNGTAGTTGTVIQTAGTVSTTGSLTTPAGTTLGQIWVGRSGGSGSYTLSGTGAVISKGDLWIGNASSNTAGTTHGTFVQQGGSVTVGAVLGVGQGGSSTSTGTYLLTGGTIQANNWDVGRGGTGEFTQNGAATTLTVTAGSTIGLGSTGTYNLKSGLLKITGGSVWAIGNQTNGSGTVNQTGGTITISASGTLLQMGRGGGAGTYNLTSADGPALLAITNRLWVGGGTGASDNNGSATFSQGAGTTVTIADDFQIGANNNSSGATTNTGTYAMTGGTLSLSKSALSWGIGNGLKSSGTMDQSGGTVTASGTTANINIGQNNGTGRYILRGDGILSINQIALASGNTNVLRTFEMSGNSQANINTFTFGTGTAPVGTRTLSITGGTAKIGALTMGTTTAAGNAEAVFGGTANVQIDTLTLSSTGRLTVNSSMNLLKRNSTTTGTDVVFSGNNPASGTVNVGAGADLTFSGTINHGGKAWDKTGPGTLTLTGAQSSAAATTLTVTGGTLNMNSAAPTNMTVAANSATNFGATQQLAALNVGNGATATLTELPSADIVLKTPILNITGGGKLDIKDNDAIVQNTPLASVRGQIVSGYNGGTWTGSGIVTTGTSPAGKSTGIGFAQGDDPAIAGLANSLGGQTFTATDSLVKFTYLGDADLDGDVDGVDVGKWATNFTGSGGSTSKLWTEGDWDYDGDVDGVDVGKWATNFTGSGGGVLDLPGAQPVAVKILSDMGFTVVPEPGSVGLLLTAACGFAARRRRRRQPTR
jgi:hypothetical protein